MSLPFKTNTIKLEAKTISEQLRSRRQEKKLKLEDIAKYLKIDYKYLEAIEKGNLEKLPPGSYGKNFLREYAIFLDLDHRGLIIDYDKEIEIIGSKVTKKDYFSKPSIRQKITLIVPKILKNIGLIMIIAICFIFIGNAVKQIFVPPFLFLDNPRQNLIINKKTINVRGASEQDAQITINGEIIINVNGVFNRDINLKKGINIIKVTAKKKYGNEQTIQRQIIVE